MATFTLPKPVQPQPARQHKFYLAPLRGITDCVFRTVYEKHFGSFDYMLAPFIPTVNGNRIRDYHIKDLLPGDNDPKRLIPQIIGYDADGFLLLSRKFAELGFVSVNWNLGCPAPRITKKKRGSGLLPHRDIIEKFLDGVIPKIPLPLSIKARLGLESKNELEALIPIFNSYPLKELIIHPRTGLQLYDGMADVDKFEICLNKSTHTVVYNGDICSIGDYEKLAKRFPGVDNWMVGRGIIKNPYLLGELKENRRTEAVISTKAATQFCAVRVFLDDLTDTCKNHFSDSAILGRMKEIWRYLGLSAGDGGALMKKIILCGSFYEYNRIINNEKLYYQKMLHNL